MSPLYRWAIKWARNTHLYLTLFGLGLLLLFAVTGFMLNHEKWFVADDPPKREATGNVPTDLLTDPPNELALVELLRREHGATGLVDLPLDISPESVRIVFRPVGGSYEATIERERGELRVESTSRGLFGVLLDLHRGKSTGFLWSLVIDGVCVLMLVISTTGLLMWWSLKGRGRFGVWTLLAGVGMIVGLYLWGMP